jgi:hypothetical protein
MKYRAFVASTRRDLERQRIHVIDRLRKANLDVIGMEDWTADPDNPAQLSAKNIAGCHFCIAIIGFQRGTISSRDARGRSITQIEIDTARAKGVRILPFVLRNTEQNCRAWPAEFNQLADEKVQRWRSEFETETTSEFFDAHEMPDVLPAVVRQIGKWEQRQRSLLQRLLLGLAAALATMILIVLISAGARDWLLSRLHQFHDPVVFQGSRDGRYKTARLLENRSDIQDNTNLRDEIGAAHNSFVMFSNTVTSFRQYESDFAAAAQRGVHLRFVVTDFSDDNRANWESFQKALEDSPQNLVETKASAANIRQLIRALGKSYPKNVEYRLNKKPILYNLWVRDPAREDGMAHIGIHYYGKIGQTYWPAYRVSRRTGGNQLKVLQDQFEVVWQNAVEDPENK